MLIGIYDPYLDTLGGGEKYMLTAASCLSKRHKVDIFWNDPSILKRAETRFALKLSRVSVTTNIFSSSVSLVKRLWETRKYNVILYLSDGSIPLTLARKLILHFQFPVEWVNGKNTTTRLKISRVDRIICNSQFTKEYIDRRFDTKSILLYPPADILGSQTQKEDMILTIGRFGRLPEGRNFKKQDVMISVFKDMVDQGLTGWTLTLVVSYKDENEREVGRLKKMIEGYPIIICTNLASWEVTSLYSKAKIYWHAAGFGEDLKRHPERAEHFGIATVEAMGAGTVPVVFRGGGQREIVEDGKDGFLWDTKEEFIQKTTDIISNEKLRLKIASNAQKKATEFSRERFCDELKRLVL